MILGSIYRPGPRKNLIFSIYGAAAPGGFLYGNSMKIYELKLTRTSIGIFFAGLTSEYSTWGWYFWIGAILTAITSITAYLTIPSDIIEKRNSLTKPNMDWWGAILIAAGLILVTFAIIDSSHASRKWETPYVYILFAVGFLFLCVSVYVEGWVAKEPLLPASLFKVPRMPALFAALFLTYGSLGIFLLYATFYMSSQMGATPLQIVAWYVPLALGGCLISTFGGFVLHLLPGTILILIAGTSWIIAALLFALAPVGASYWAYIFPSMVCATIGIDITFNVANIFITTSLPKKQQGLAGAVIMLLLHLGIAVFLGFADVLHSYEIEKLGERGAFKAVFWFEVACAALALVILTLFVKIDAAQSDLTFEEREELELTERTTRLM